MEFLGFSGPDADLEMLSDFAVAQAARDELEHLTLALGQCVEHIRRRFARELLQVSAHHPIGERRTDETPSLGGVPDRLNELFGARLLQHVSESPTPEGFGDVRLACRHGKDDDACLGSLLLQMPQNVKPGHPGHHQVEKEHVGPQLVDEGDDLGAVARCTNQPEIGLGDEQRLQPLPDHRVIVGDQEGDHAPQCTAATRGCRP